MREFGQRLGCERKPIALVAQGSGESPGRHVIGVARNFCRHEKTRVEPVRHTRPPSMSSYQSSRVPSGFSIRPKSSGGKSRALRPLPLAFVNRAFRTNRSSSANSSVEN
jgi:hypothetical protein